VLSIWKHFVGVYRSRNLLVHDYFLIDAAIVWGTIENYIPQLEALLDTIIFDNDGGGDGSGGANRPEVGCAGQSSW